MTKHAKRDQALLTDYLLGRCDGTTGQAIEKRLAEDPDFRALHNDLANTFSALRLVGEPQVPPDLADRTMARINSTRRADATRARRQLSGAAGRPTFSLGDLGALAAAAVLIACLFIPWARQARRRALAGECASNVGQIGQAMGNYALANNGMLPAAPRLGAAWLAGGGRRVASNSAGLFRLIRQGYAPPVIFQCPAAAQAAGVAFVAKSDIRDFPAEKFINYSYQHALGPKPLSNRRAALTDVAEKMAILSDSTPLFTGGLFRPEHLNQPSSDNHQQRGHSVLYLDWHVQWKRRPNVGVGGDNIYLVQGVVDYKGTETPASDTDSFILPAWSGGADEQN